MNLKLPKCKITTVFGPVASGKTHLIKLWMQTENRVVCFDQTGELIDDPSYKHVYANPRQLAMMLKENPYYFRIAYEPGQDLETDFSWILKALWVTPTEKLLVCDECHELVANGQTNDQVKMMLRFARHDKLGFLGVSQRIADVHKLLTTFSRMVVLFSTREARDLDAIRDRWGNEVKDMVTNLRPLLHDDATNTTRQVPQCVVLELGQPPRVFDFKTDNYVNPNSTRRDDDGNRTEMENDSEDNDIS